ncbi:unnamed protein product [Fraxinus pennsylvanica]|uniref:t-SNARE coiled-coil homology domain-containing protein n=1 Tax=Fraxinus pennsylvanica TaxID=56036 RepID=A0AAD1ZRI8_9LAMI|nr:unnamed protein product [Fraxinus pennsylvanica]
MNSRRERNARAALFDGIEEGGIQVSSSYSSREIDEQENDRAIDGLQERVSLLKRLSGDVHEEVEAHNSMLDRMGNDMDASRGVLSGTMDKFKMVFETKSSRNMFTLVASFVVIFLIIYYLTRGLPMQRALEYFVECMGTVSNFFGFFNIRLKNYGCSTVDMKKEKHVHLQCLEMDILVLDLSAQSPIFAIADHVAR